MGEKALRQQLEDAKDAHPKNMKAWSECLVNMDGQKQRLRCRPRTIGSGVVRQKAISYASRPYANSSMAIQRTFLLRSFGKCFGSLANPIMTWRPAKTTANWCPQCWRNLRQTTRRACESSRS